MGDSRIEFPFFVPNFNPDSNSFKVSNTGLDRISVYGRQVD